MLILPGQLEVRKKGGGRVIRGRFPYMKHAVLTDARGLDEGNWPGKCCLATGAGSQCRLSALSFGGNVKANGGFVRRFR